MTVGAGIGLFVIGMVVTFLFFIGLFYVMENDDPNKKDRDDNHFN